VLLTLPMTTPRKSTRRRAVRRDAAVQTDGQKLRSLTPREAEVLTWLIEGKRDAEIGAILTISKLTVHKHAQRIYEKLGVETRTAAARVAIMGGFKSPGNGGCREIRPS
jgi:DNA-binding NarL/FixJ family response regulator